MASAPLAARCCCASLYPTAGCKSLGAAAPSAPNALSVRGAARRAPPRPPGVALTKSLRRRRGPGRALLGEPRGPLHATDTPRIPFRALSRCLGPAGSWLPLPVRSTARPAAGGCRLSRRCESISYTGKRRAMEREGGKPLPAPGTQQPQAWPRCLPPLARAGCHPRSEAPSGAARRSCGAVRAHRRGRAAAPLRSLRGERGFTPASQEGSFPPEDLPRLYFFFFCFVFRKPLSAEQFPHHTPVIV